MYDSLKDLDAHQANFKKIMARVMSELKERTNKHDESKRESPELECYNKYIPKLQEVEYNSDEYKELKQEMLDNGLQHHFDNNRHHIEHFEDGILGMDLIDLIECLVDWVAASMRSSSPFEKGLEANKDSFNIPDPIYKIFENTLPLIEEWRK
jgi:hypothetical protein